jgi:hypothetical protein
MELFLMHKDIKVAKIKISDLFGSLTEVLEIYEEEHLPVGCFNQELLAKWWSLRAIPASREGLNEALSKIGVNYSQSLLTRSLGLSLFDCYWVNDGFLKWKDVNFYENNFSEDIGKILFGGWAEHIDFNSPDITVDGWLKKRWKIINDERCLIKGGSSVTQQEPLNEVIASSIAANMGIPCVDYRLIWIEDLPFSVCKTFASVEEEFIPALYYTLETGRLEIKMETQKFLDEMLVFDFIIGNKDRHYGNFGFLRNPDTLELKTTAPLFDNGSCLWYNEINFDWADCVSRPFAKRHSEQIKLVKDFSWVNFKKLEQADEICAEIFKQSKYIGGNRSDKLCKAIKERINLLQIYIAENPKGVNKLNVF